MPSETAWKARFARLWNACEKADVADRALAHQRVLIALEAYRQVALPGSPGPAALGRVASVRNRNLVAVNQLRASGSYSPPSQLGGLSRSNRVRTSGQETGRR